MEQQRSFYICGLYRNCRKDWGLCYGIVTVVVVQLCIPVILDEVCQVVTGWFRIHRVRSCKLNGHVERAQRTHTEEFYELYDGKLWRLW